MRTILRFIAGFLLAFALPASLWAQLLVGIGGDSPGDATGGWEVDVTDESSRELWSPSDNIGVWGMAYDPVGQYVYNNHETTLYRTHISGGPTEDLGRLSIVPLGLAWADDQLWVSSDSNEAIYSIDINTSRAATLVLDIDDSQYQFSGLAFNSEDNLFYGISNDPEAQGRGLYTLDVLGNGDIEFVIDSPDNQTGIGGLAIGENVAYLVNGRDGESIYRYDLSTGLWLDPLSSPMTNNSRIQAGAAFVAAVPEPGSFIVCALAVGALAVTRRSRY